MLTWELLGQACLSLKSTSRFLADWSLSLSWLINSKLLLLSVEADAGGSPLQDRAVLWSLLVIGGGRWAPTQQLLGSQCSPAPLLTHSLLLPLDLSCLFWFLSYIKLLHILKLCLKLELHTDFYHICWDLIILFILKTFVVFSLHSFCPQGVNLAVLEEGQEHYHGVLSMMILVQILACCLYLVVWPWRQIMEQKLLHYNCLHFLSCK